MAWQYRVTVVSTVPARREIGRDPLGEPIMEDYLIDLVAEGRCGYRVDYFDSARPGTLLHSRFFDIPGSVPLAEIEAKFRSVGVAERDRDAIALAKQQAEADAIEQARASAAAARQTALTELQGKTFPVDG